MTSTSVSLLDRLRTDDQSDAWREFASMYSPLLRGWLKRYSLQSSDTDDLLQEVLLTVSRELPKFKHSGNTGAFRHWLKMILVNRLRNHWRSRSLREIAAGGSSVFAELQALEDASSDVSRLWDAEHDRHVLAGLLQKIRPRFGDSTWSAFQRVMFDGCRTVDVAVELGISLKAVHLAKSRVLNALRAEAAGLIPDHGMP